MWYSLTTWITFHNAKFVNAALSFYMVTRNVTGDICTRYVFEVILYYDDSNAILRFAGTVCTKRPAWLPRATLYSGDKVAVKIGRRHLGESYVTGEYIVMAKWQ